MASTIGAKSSFAVIVPAYKAAATLADCLSAIRSADRQPDQIIIFNDGLTENAPTIARMFGAKLIENTGPRRGAAGARNAAAREASSSILMFVDADVVVAADAFGLILDEIASAPEIHAAFGSYDDAPRVTRLAALYTNLRHHWVHQESERDANTFWTGVGGVRTDAFWALDGFDIDSGVEDIDLGGRIRRSGGKVHLVHRAFGKHLKNWSVPLLWYTDTVHRALPWAKLIASGRCPSGSLNTSVRERASAIVAYAVVVSLVGCLFSAWPALACVSAVSLYLFLNRGFFGLLKRKGGWPALLSGVALHFVYHLYASGTFGIVIIATRLKEWLAAIRQTPAAEPKPSPEFWAQSRDK